MISDDDKKEYLAELRNLFRKEMEEHDFCIGEEKVERIFRTLLGEPEPKPVVYDNPIGGGISSEEIGNIFEKTIAKDISKMFERDDTFYGKLK